MKNFKALFTLTLLITCLVFSGCSSKSGNDDEKKSQTASSASGDNTAVKKAKPLDDKGDKIVKPKTAPADDPVTAALKSYAKGITSLYCADFNILMDDVRFMLVDFSGDGKPELLAVGVYEDDMSYMEIYAYSEGKVSKCFEGQCGAANGINMHPVRYKGVAYVMRESISSANGFYQQLMQYKDNDWVTVYSSYVEFDFYNGGEKTGCIVNDAPASDADYDALRAKVEEGYIRINEFVLADEL